jgi:hypothetical protein
MADPAPSSFSGSRRPLTAAERRLIRRKIRSLTARGHRASKVALPITSGAVLLLWGWTVLASDASWLIVTAFWVAVGGVLALWIHRDMHKHSERPLAGRYNLGLLLQ